MCSTPKMRVLNNNNGALTYNRCTPCDVSELKCKVGLRQRPSQWCKHSTVCTGQTVLHLACDSHLHGAVLLAHTGRPDNNPTRLQDALSCAPGANGALDGCTACRTGSYLATVSVKYIDASSGTATETTQDYRGCKSCAEAFGCVAGAACDASE